MFGQNPKRLPEKGDGSSLQVQEIFATFQGEGPYTGVPAIFIRLGGCNLACDFCDTEFESFERLTLDSVVEKVIQLRTSSPSDPRLIVLTGGEPFRQPIAPLCEALLAAGYRIQIETNGTLYRAIPREVEIVCSPKASENGYFPPRADVLAQTIALKFLIDAEDPLYNDVPAFARAAGDIPLYLQAIDRYDPEKNRRNLEHTRALVKEYGCKLSLQTHKLAGAP